MAKKKEELENEVQAVEAGSESESEVEATVDAEVVEAEIVEEGAETDVEVVEGEPEVETEVEALQERLETLETELEEAEAQAAEYLDGWQRTQASFSNFRKRTERERKEWQSTSNAALLSKLLPILDDFERAFSVMPDSLKDDAWFSGIKLIQRKIESILETEKVQPIDADPGDTFDPQYHQAVLHQETDEFEDGQIMTVVEKGYMLGKRVLRPSMVVVAKEPSAKEPSAKEPSGDEETDADVAAEAAASESNAESDAA